MAYKAKHPRNIPASYYKPIGQILVRWTYTELYMQSIIWHLFKVKNPKAARLLTWGRNAVDLTKLFFSLTPRWIPDAADQAELITIHSKAERIRANRNKLAHGLWGYKPGNRKQLEIYFLRENDVKIKPIPLRLNLATLQTWASDLDALNVRLKAFHKKLGAPVS